MVSLSSALFRLTTWLNIFTKDGRQSTLEYMMVAFCFYMIAIDAKALISYKILVREASAVKADKFTLQNACLSSYTMISIEKENSTLTE